MAKRKAAPAAALSLPAKVARVAESPEADDQLQSPFFCKLNRDVRMLIFDNLDLPPYSGGKNIRGLLLSCRLAHSEAAEAAIHKLKTEVHRFEKEFKKKTSIHCVINEIPVDKGFHGLKTLTITLPIAALVKEDNTIAVDMQPLLAHYFNKVTLVFKRDNDTQTLPPCASPKYRARSFGGYWYRLRRHFTPARYTANDIRPWRKWAARLLDDFVYIIPRTFTFPWNGLTVPEPLLDPIRTQAISVVWDVRTTEEAKESDQRRGPFLQGVKFQPRTHTRCSFYADHRRNKTTCYELRSKKALLGEFTIEDGSRWFEWDKSLRSLVFRTDKVGIGSDGIGEPIRFL